MVRIGFHASHEQLGPRALRDAVVDAEAAGFQAAMCSDHLAPWSHRQGQSGNAWTWLGSALEATDLSMGVVTAPGQRYHPAVAAQSIATLGEMFPGRFWAALGSGEALNEHVTGDPWPAKSVRDERLLECVEVIRALLRGEEVTHDGLVRVHRARVWSRPETPPALFGAAVSEQTARVVGSWADGLITVNQPEPVLRRVIEAFRRGGRQRQAGPRAGAPVLGGRRHYRPGDRARAVAHQRVRTGAHVGAGAARGVRRRSLARTPRGRGRGGHDLLRCGAAREVAGPDRRAGRRHALPPSRRHRAAGFIETFGERVIPQVAS